jgi:hypothetical protein
MHIAEGLIISPKSAFQRDNGFVGSENGVTLYITILANDGDYFIGVKHRNYLAVLRSNAVILNWSYIIMNGCITFD